MQHYYPLATQGQPRAALAAFLQQLLTREIIDVILAAAPSPHSPMPLPTLFADADQLTDVDLLAPVAPFNAARQSVSVLRRATGQRVALVLRPCELRALVELVKLNQAVLQDAVLIGLECRGRMESDQYLQQSLEPVADSAFLQNSELDAQLCRTCRTCDQFEPHGADLSILTLGLPLTETVGLQAQTPRGTAIMERLAMRAEEPPAHRGQHLAQLHRKRSQARTELFQQTAQIIGSIQKCQQLLANCLSCHNCRTACPLCYCKACVFTTDLFDQAPEVLLRRTQKRGRLKLPADSTMFHWTRLAHMSHACVGCGHCSSVCPSNIPVADIFRTVAEQVQRLYEYEPGRDVLEKIPLLDFAPPGAATAVPAVKNGAGVSSHV